jgi:hypothetical protein
MTLIVSLSLALVSRGHVRAAFASTPESIPWSIGTSGSVQAIARGSGATVYIGGSFSLISSTSARGLAQFNATTGAYIPGLPETNGNIEVIISDGGTGWFVGGRFTRIGATTVSNLAHVLSDGTVDVSFIPLIGDTSGNVRALLLDGTTLYVGGLFGAVGATNRGNIAALDLSGGISAWTLMAFNPVTNGAVEAMLVSGSTLYIGGAFTDVNLGVVRKSVAAFVGAPTAYIASDFNPCLNATVYALELDGTTLYAGGDFSQVNQAACGGQTPATRNGIAAFDTTQSVNNVTAFDPSTMQAWSVSGGVRALALDTVSGSLYAGGMFESVNWVDGVGGVARAGLAAFDTATSTENALPFDPQFDGGAAIQSLRMNGDVLTVAGDFIVGTGVGERHHLAQFSIASGLFSDFAPKVNAAVNDAIISGGTVVAGGAFSHVGGVFRNGFAAIDVSTHHVLPFNPLLRNAVSSSGVLVKSLVYVTNTLYIGGAFATVTGGTVRHGIAAFDTSTPAGSLLPFDPDVTSSLNNNLPGTVSAMVLDGTTLYAGGSFDTVNGGTTRNFMAAFDVTIDTNNATAFDPDFDDAVNAIVVDSANSTVYAGGNFTGVSGGITTRNGVAALNSATGAARSLNPDVGGTVSALALSGTTLYIGGEFSSIKGGASSRNSVAAVSTVSGAATSFNPDITEGGFPGSVSSLLFDGQTLFVGGGFSTVNGVVTRRALAAFDDTGTVTSFDANFTGSLSIAVASGSVLYAGGSFSAAGGAPMYGYAVFLDAGGGATPTPTPTPSPTASIFLRGKQFISLQVGDSYSDAGAEALDVAGSDATASIVTSGSVDTTTPGTYTISYMYDGITRARTVRVLATDGRDFRSDPSPHSIGASSNGSVCAFEKDDTGRVYLGGQFSSIGERSGTGQVLLDPVTGAHDGEFPLADDTMYDATPDGSGGWYVGGAFTTFGGRAISRLAHVRSDRTVDPDFSFAFNGDVRALLRIENTLYVGGDFTAIGSTTRYGLAAINLNTRAVTSLNVSPEIYSAFLDSWTPGSVHALAASSGTLYIGGTFTHVSNRSLLRGNVAGINLGTGAITSFTGGINNSVKKLVADGATLYVVGGTHASVTPGTYPIARNQVAAFDVSDNTLSAFEVSVGGELRDMAVYENRVFVAGDFAFAEVDPSTGATLSTIATATATSRFVIHSGVVYLGRVNVSPNTQAFNLSDGSALTTFAPAIARTLPSAVMFECAQYDIASQKLYFCGDFDLFGSTAKSGFAAYDVASTSFSDLDLGADVILSSMVRQGNRLYVAGFFTSILGASRKGIAAIDLTTNTLLPFDPQVDGRVLAIAVEGATVYAVGDFTDVNAGTTRNNAAAFNAETGAVLPFHPNIGPALTAIARSVLVDGPVVYIGGSFTSVNGGTPRNNLAAFNATTGALVAAFDPNVTNGIDATKVHALALHSGTLFFGGQFSSVGGAERRNIAAVNASTGALSSFDVPANNSVNAFAVDGSRLYIGGSFTTLGGAQRVYLGAADVRTGSLLNYSPSLANTVCRMITDENGLDVSAGTPGIGI